MLCPFLYELIRFVKLVAVWYLIWSVAVAVMSFSAFVVVFFVLPATVLNLVQLYRKGGLRPPPVAESNYSKNNECSSAPTSPIILSLAAPPAAPCTPPRVQPLPAAIRAPNTTSSVTSSSHITAAAVSSTIPSSHSFIRRKALRQQAPLPIQPVPSTDSPIPSVPTSYSSHPIAICYTSSRGSFRHPLPQKVLLLEVPHPVPPSASRTITSAVPPSAVSSTVTSAASPVASRTITSAVPPSAVSSTVTSAVPPAASRTITSAVPPSAVSSTITSAVPPAASRTITSAVPPSAVSSTVTSAAVPPAISSSFTSAVPPAASRTITSAVPPSAVSSTVTSAASPVASRTITSAVPPSTVSPTFTSAVPPAVSPTFTVFTGFTPADLPTLTVEPVLLMKNADGRYVEFISAAYTTPNMSHLHVGVCEGSVVNGVPLASGSGPFDPILHWGPGWEGVPYGVYNAVECRPVCCVAVEEVVIN
ncbi:hypothetical protein Vretifemale_16176 [Volvox reticuliferus]|uniref:Uncharacterized protein n=1 Tax=Volvox reticuliferus TaxID=1737510 RepID=A0A8J4CX27_9CHLO|nr:hypothetical protein Vretifemale_16176 [Volvox reticuliferus]